MNPYIRFAIFTVVVFNLFMTNVLADTQEQIVAQQDQMRTVWQPSGVPFIRHWLICGQFPTPSPDDDGMNTDYLIDKGGEINISPHEGMTHMWSNIEYKWITYDSPTDLVDIAEALKSEPANFSISYAYATLKSQEDKQVFLALGSDDDVILYVNGEKVHTNFVGRPVYADADLVVVNLKKGENQLLFKIHNRTGGVGVCARLADENMIRQRPAIVTILNAPINPKQLTIQLDNPLITQVVKLPPVQLELVASGGKTVASQIVQRGKKAIFNIASLRDGAYEIRCITMLPNGRKVVSHTPYYKGDILNAVKRLIQYATSPMEGDLISPMLAELVQSRLDDDIDNITTIPDYAFYSIHSALMEFEELELAHKYKTAQIHPYGFVRLAWIDEIDNSVQFCRVYLPDEYNPTKKWPMVVSLHGYYGENPPYINWWAVDARHSDLAYDKDVIYIEPHGRGNTAYEGFGRLDILRAIEIAKERFSVDPERILLIGYSMGGWGTWHVGTRHPDIFTAIAPVFGGSDYHIELDTREFNNLTQYERFQLEKMSSFVNAESLLTTPIFVNHGDSDLSVRADYSRYVVRMLQRWGYNLRYWEHPDKGHENLSAEDEILHWFLSMRRVHPDHVRLRAAELKYARSHWLEVTQHKNQWDMILGEAEITEPNTIKLDTQNALEVVLTPGEIVDINKPIKVIWNIFDIRTVIMPQDGRIVLQASGYSPEELIKTPQMEGPLYDVTNTPFAYVIGTVSQNPVMREVCCLYGNFLVGQWEKWQHVMPRVFVDTELSEQDSARYSLILIGGSEANLVTRKLIDKLPLKIDGNTVTLDGKSFDAPNSVVGMVYPNPLNSQRYVRIYAATTPMAMFNHELLSWEMVREMMDFYIDDGHAGNWRRGVADEKVLVAGGVFDNTWHISDKFTIIGDADLRAKTLVRKLPVYLSVPTDLDSLMLSDLVYVDAQGGFTKMKRDTNWFDKPIVFADKTYDYGIGVGNLDWDPKCWADFDISPASFKRFKTTVGIENEQLDKMDLERKERALKRRDRAQVSFIVIGDGKELYRSPAFVWDSVPIDVDVNVEGVKTLRLQLVGEQTEDVIASVDLADARLEK